MHTAPHMVKDDPARVAPPDDHPEPSDHWQKRIEAEALSMVLEVKSGCYNDGRCVVDEAWGEERTPAELRDLTSHLESGVAFGGEPDFTEIGRIFANIVYRYALKGADLDVAQAELTEIESDTAMGI